MIQRPASLLLLGCLKGYGERTCAVLPTAPHFDSTEFRRGRSGAGLIIGEVMRGSNRAKKGRPFERPFSECLFVSLEQQLDVIPNVPRCQLNN